VKALNGADVVRQSSNKWEGNKAYDTTTKTEASQSLTEKKADPNAALREAGGNYETANNANLSGRPHLVKALNGAAVVRETSNKWEGNKAYDTTTKTEAS